MNANIIPIYAENNYILGPGDRILVRVSDIVPELNFIYSIDIGGNIVATKLGKLFVSGLTVDELEDLLEKKYASVIINPSIEIIIQSYRPVKVYVDGEVENPGMYVLNSSIGTEFNNMNEIQNQINSISRLNELGQNEITISNNLASGISQNTSLRDLNQLNALIKIFERGPLSSLNNEFPTLFDALKASGGITNFSDLSSVEIVRKDTISNGGGGKNRAEVDFLALLNEGDTDQNIRVLDGDVIRVKRSEKEITTELLKAAQSNLNPKTIKIFIAGRVENPGLVMASKASTLNDAIKLAGGTKFLKGKINFIRYNSDGSIENRKFRYKPNAKRGSSNNPFLKNSDIIAVGKSGINIVNEVLTEVTSPFLGIYTTTKVIQDLSL